MNSSVEVIKSREPYNNFIPALTAFCFTQYLGSILLPKVIFLKPIFCLNLAIVQYTVIDPYELQAI